MGQFAWVGGSTAISGNYQNPLGNYSYFAGKTGNQNMNWILAFDWNNPNNWREYSSTSNTWISTTRSPSNGDQVSFAINNLGQVGLPRAIAPCLFGGASASGINTTWWGGSAGGNNYTGTTFNSSINSLNLGAFGFDPATNFNTAWLNDKTLPPYIPISNYQKQYPFGFIGGGLHGATWIDYSNSPYGGIVQYETEALENAARNGFVLNQAIWGSVGISGGTGTSGGGGGSGGYGGNSGTQSGYIYGSRQYWNNLLYPIFGWSTSFGGGQVNGGTGGTNRLRKISIKTAYIAAWTNPSVSNALVGSSFDIRHKGEIQFDCLKHYSVIPPGACGAGATYTYVSTNAYLTGTPNYRLSGWFNTITRTGVTAESWLKTLYQEYAPYQSTLVGGIWNTPIVRATKARRHLTLEGATVAMLRTEGNFHNGSWYADRTSNIANMEISTRTVGMEGTFRSNFSREAVYADLGLTGAATGGVFSDPQVKIGGFSTYPNWENINPGDGYSNTPISRLSSFSFGKREPGTPTIDTTKAVIQSMEFGTIGSDPSSTRGWLGLQSYLRILSLKTNNANVASGIQDMPPYGFWDGNIEIGEYNMNNSSNLYLGRVPYMSNVYPYNYFGSDASVWNFGKMDQQTGLVNGGIIFEDEDSYVYTNGSTRLYNDQIDTVGLRTGASVRGGKTSYIDPPEIALD